ncbi:MAG: phosphonate ABC transporter, permease protein PhnE [Chloroflexota bacterium]
MAVAESVRTQTLTPDLRRRVLAPINPPSITTLGIWLVALIVLAWCIQGTEINLQKLERGFPAMGRFFASLWPPDNAAWLKMIEPIVATLQMAVLGTILSVILAFPFGLVAARNTAPNLIVYGGARMVLNTVRAIPQLVWAIIFVAALGFGPFAGVVALGIGGLGVVGKLYAEAIEAINPRPVEAIRATGSHPLQVFAFAVLPQALPLMVSYTLLDFEANVRSATILGIVGAGGIGFELQASFSQFKFHEVLTILLEIIIMVTAIDRVSAFVRNRII